MDILQRIEAVLDRKIRPVLQSHGGEVKLTGYENGVAYVELLGACSGCPSADLGTKRLMEEILRAELPEVERVEAEHPVSESLLGFARQLLQGEEL